MQKTTAFNKHVSLRADVDTAFKWHQSTGTLERLSPPWERIEVLASSGSIQDGAKVSIRNYMGPIPITWKMEHYGYKAGQQFCDKMLKGPFAYWDHQHLFHPIAENSSELQDNINYRLPFSPWGDWLGHAFVRQKLEKLFHYRHQITAWDTERLADYKERGGLPMKILLTGASGMVGQALLPFLTAQGHTVVILSRSSSPKEGQLSWNPEKNKLNPSDLEGFDAVVHLAGESISKRWTPEQKQKIKESRVHSTQLLTTAIAQLKNPPKLFISASAIGFYGNRGLEPLTEASAPGHDFLAEVCQAWEADAQPAKDKGLRVAHLRFGLILSPKGGALAQILPPFQLGIGGPLGGGKQIMSWISIEDVIGVIHHVLTTDSVSGPVNTVAPNPVSNAEFSKTLGQVLFRPWFAPVPTFAVKLLFGEMGDALLLSSAQVIPQKLMDTGYTFRHPQLEGALRFLLGKSV